MTSSTCLERVSLNVGALPGALLGALLTPLVR
jgi:hypothetical protein